MAAATQHHKYSTESCATTADSNTSEIPTVAGSDTSVSSGELVHSHSVVRGFSTALGSSSSYRSQSRLAPVVASPKPTPQQRTEVSKKKNVFTLGAGSSGDDESSFEDRMSYRQRQSSLTEGLNTEATKPQKQLSFRNVVESRTIRPIKETAREHEDAIESDDEEEEVSESAIEDDDDSSDWEDSVSESGRSSPLDDKQLFQRVDSRPNLTSRRSLLTTALHEPHRAAALAAAAARSTPTLQRSRNSSPNGPSLAASPEDDENTGLTMRGPNIPRSKPIIMTTSNTHPPAHSPRTTRRNMLATELTESLRKHLLWERQQKSTTANAVFKRRHTAIDVTKLQDYPGQKPGTQASKDASKNNSWNHYFDYGPWEYHVKGW